jgi:hypothetical protein
MNTKSTRVSVTFSKYLKGKLEQFSEKHSCSQAEVLRMGFLKLMEAEK